MRVGFVSTYAMNASIRTQTMRMQSQLSQAQLEVATGKKANIGLELGSMTSQLVSIENQIQMIERIQTTTSFVTNRMAIMQNSMASIITSGQDFVGQLTVEVNGALDRDLLEQIGTSALDHFTSTLNTTFKGEYVFSGINTDVAALNEYDPDDGSGSAAKTAVIAAFTTEFGFAPSSPLATNITATELETFIDGPFADLFDDTNWPALWSGSSDRGMRSKISPMELAENPTTAQGNVFREITAAVILIKEFSQTEFSDSANSMLATKALEGMAQGVNNLAAEQSKIGTVEKRIEEANERMEYQRNILREQAMTYENVDPYEVATRLNQLSISLEASYRATAKLQQLSLMNYI